MPKGGAREGAGRPKGTVSRSTHEARQAVSDFVNGNTPKLSKWLEEVYHQDGPKAAIECLSKFTDYCVPKLKSVDTTISGNPDAPLVTSAIELKPSDVAKRVGSLHEQYGVVGSLPTEA